LLFRRKKRKKKRERFPAPSWSSQKEGSRRDHRRDPATAPKKGVRGRRKELWGGCHRPLPPASGLAKKGERGRSLIFTEKEGKKKVKTATEPRESLRRRERSAIRLPDRRRGRKRGGLNPGERCRQGEGGEKADPSPPFGVGSARFDRLQEKEGVHSRHWKGKGNWEAAMRLLLGGRKEGGKAPFTQSTRGGGKKKTSKGPGARGLIAKGRKKGRKGKECRHCLAFHLKLWGKKKKKKCALDGRWWSLRKGKREGEGQRNEISSGPQSAGENKEGKKGARKMSYQRRGGGKKKKGGGSINWAASAPASRFERGKRREGGPDPVAALPCGADREKKKEGRI